MQPRTHAVYVSNHTDTHTRLRSVVWSLVFYLFLYPVEEHGHVGVHSGEIGSSAGDAPRHKSHQIGLAVSLDCQWSTRVTLQCDGSKPEGKREMITGYTAVIQQA